MRKGEYREFDIAYFDRFVDVKRTNPAIDVGAPAFTAGSAKAKAAGREAARSKRHMGVQQRVTTAGHWEVPAHWDSMPKEKVWD